MRPTGFMLKRQATTAASRVSDQVRRLGKGLQKEREASSELHGQVQATLQHLKLVNPSLAGRLDDAHAFAVFPSVGRASALVGVSYGRGEVFRRGRLVGYAGVAQLTLGVQAGGQTYTEVLLFKDRSHLEYFKQGKVSFAANLAALAVKAGGATTNDVHGIEVHLFSRGGFQLDVSLGGQKFIYRPAALSRGKRGKA